MDVVDLPDLPELRARWRLLAIASLAGGLPDLWASSTTSDTHADPIGSGLELLVLRAGTAVLTGFDAELDDEEAWADPLLLTEGAPTWVRSAVQEVAPLGDAAWWDGTGWFRSPAAAGVPRSVEVLATPVLSDEGVAEELLTLLEDPATDEQRALALDIARGAPLADRLIRLYTGARFGFTAEAAHAAVAEYS